MIDELDLRFGDREPAVLDAALREEVLLPYFRARRLIVSKHSGRIEFQIDRLLLRERFRQLVREQFGLAERGLDSSLLIVKPEVFIVVVLRLTNADAASLPLENAAPEVRPAVSPFRLFAEQFAKSAGAKAGERAVEWTERLLTAGLADALDLLRAWQR